MKWFFKMMLPALLLASCNEENKQGIETLNNPSAVPVEEVAGHESMVLGRKLSNPYSVSNIKRAVEAVCPTKASLDVPVTSLYVRFLPQSEEEYSLLSDAGVDMLDHPVDYEIIREGDYYHDPSLDAESMTWQYAVVDPSFNFPSGIRYEILDECCIPGDDTATKSITDVDWDAVERESFELTGNGGMLDVETRSRTAPEGKIQIIDDSKKKNSVEGVSGVKVMANTFVRIASAYTDSDGRYSFDKKFSAKPHYRICFKNKIGFTIGMNMILVPASLSSLGKGSPSGIDVTVDHNSDDVLYRRCAVNNAAVDYYSKCSSEGITPPPTNLRFWILGFVRPSCTVMMHHGAVLDSKLVSEYLGIYRVIVRVFAPDITIGAKDKEDNYSYLYASTVHEMAHASHYQKAGSSYWAKFITYILKSYLTTGSCYGTGNASDAGYCELGEMWGFFIENSFFKARYGYDPGQGNGYWFFPQLLSDLEKEGVTKTEMCESMGSAVTSLSEFKSSLLGACSSKKAAITQVFKKYSK